MQGLIRGASVVVLLVDLASDDGIDDCQAVLDRLNATKTRLGKETFLDEDDIGLSYTRTLVVPNKIDADGAADRLALLHELLPLEFDEFVISAEQGTGLDALKNAIYQSLDVVRVYTKSPTAKQADFEKPFTIHRGGTLLQIAEQVHKDFAENLSHARVWGEAVHPGSTMKGDYVLHDKDVVELHTT
jgi:ribosome-interacting GTPase 1